MASTAGSPSHASPADIVKDMQRKLRALRENPPRRVAPKRRACTDVLAQEQSMPRKKAVRVSDGAVGGKDSKAGAKVSPLIETTKQWRNFAQFPGIRTGVPQKKPSALHAAKRISFDSDDITITESLRTHQPSPSHGNITPRSIMKDKSWRNRALSAAEEDALAEAEKEAAEIAEELARDGFGPAQLRAFVRARLRYELRDLLDEE